LSPAGFGTLAAYALVTGPIKSEWVFLPGPLIASLGLAVLLTVTLGLPGHGMPSVPSPLPTCATSSAGRLPARPLSTKALQKNVGAAKAGTTNRERGPEVRLGEWTGRRPNPQED